MSRLGTAREIERGRIRGSIKEAFVYSYEDLCLTDEEYPTRLAAFQEAKRRVAQQSESSDGTEARDGTKPRHEKIERPQPPRPIFMGCELGIKDRRLRWRHSPEKVEKWSPMFESVFAALGKTTSPASVAKCVGVLIWDHTIRSTPLIALSEEIDLLRRTAKQVGKNYKAWAWNNFEVGADDVQNLQSQWRRLKKE